MIATSTIYTGFVDGFFLFSVKMGGIVLIIVIIVNLITGLIRKF